MTRPLVVCNWKMHGDGTWLHRVDVAAATTLMRDSGIDGLLVGGASLDPESFAAIIAAAA